MLGRVRSNALVKQPLDLSLQHKHVSLIPRIPARCGFSPGFPPSEPPAAISTPARSAPSAPSQPSPELDSTQRSSLPSVKNIAGESHAPPENHSPSMPLQAASSPPGFHSTPRKQSLVLRSPSAAP